MLYKKHKQEKKVKQAELPASHAISSLQAAAGYIYKEAPAPSPSLSTTHMPWRVGREGKKALRRGAAAPLWAAG